MIFNRLTPRSSLGDHPPSLNNVHAYENIIVVDLRCSFAGGTKSDVNESTF